MFLKSLILGVSVYLLIACGDAYGYTCKHTDDTFKCVTYIYNYDADTVTVDIHDTHPIIGSGIKIRISGVDAAEIKGDSECERAIAQIGKKEVEDILDNAEVINLTNIGRGKYFRIAADVIADGVDIGQYLIKRKLAYPYNGGKKKDIDWCSLLLHHID